MQKWLSEEALEIGEKGRETKGKGEKERYTHLNAESQRIAWRDKKACLSDQCKPIEENNGMERLEFSSRKLETPRERLKRLEENYRLFIVLFSSTGLR